MHRHQLNRRQVIAALGTGAFTGLSGCASLLNGDETVKLQRVGIVNWTDRALTVHVRVHHDNEVVEQTQVEFTPEEQGHVLDCTWPTDPGVFSISARLSETDEWEKKDVTDSESDCAAVLVSINETVNSSPAVSLPVSRDCDFYADSCP